MSYDVHTGQLKQKARSLAIQHITSTSKINAEYIMFPSERANCIEEGCRSLNFPIGSRFHCIEMNESVITKSKQAISKLRLKRLFPINPTFYQCKFEDLDVTELEKNLKHKLSGAFHDLCGQITHGNQAKSKELRYLMEPKAPVAFTLSLVNRNGSLLEDDDEDYSGHQVPDYELHPEYLEELFNSERSYKDNYFNTLKALEKAGYKINKTFCYRDKITDEKGFVLKAKRTVMLLVLATVK